MLSKCDLDNIEALSRCIYDNYPEYVGIAEYETAGNLYTSNSTILTGYYNNIYKSTHEKLKAAAEAAVIAMGWQESVTPLGLKTAQVQYFPIGGM